MLPFLKELVFGKMKEKPTTGILYKFRGWVILLIIMFLIMMNTIMVDKLYKLSSAHIKITKQIAQQETIKEQLATCKIELATASSLCLPPNKPIPIPR